MKQSKNKPRLIMWQHIKAGKIVKTVRILPDGKAVKVWQKS